jgi:hypothetical protein
MTTHLHVLLSYKHFKGQIQSTLAMGADSHIPRNMTHLFRMNFWAAFDRVAKIEFDKTSVRYLDLDATVNTVVLFKTNKRRLTESGGHDHVVYFCLQIENSLDNEQAKHATAATIELLQEREDVIRQTPAHWLLGHLESDHIGHSAFIAEAPDRFAEDLMCLAAFFFYAWILILRIEREQSAMNISPDMHTIARSSRDIIAQRVRLLNMERYFLSIDRTNVGYLKDICLQLVKKYRLSERHERAARLHASFEHHMDNTEKALQSRRFSTLTNMIAILTLISIPLATLQVMFGINLSSSIFREWRDIFSNHIIFVSVALALAMAAIPLVALRVFDTVTAAIRRRRSL